MKPSPKFIIVLNLTLNLPIALAMSIVASLMNGGITTLTWILAFVGFVLACIISAVINVQKISGGFAGLFKLSPESVVGRFVGNVPVCIIYTAVILAVMLVINIGFVVPDIFFAFLGMFAPLFIVAYVVSMIMTPIAFKAATAASKA